MDIIEASGRVKVKSLSTVEKTSLAALFGIDVYTFAVIMSQIFSLKGVHIHPDFYAALFGIHLGQLINIVRLKRQ